MGKLRLKRTPEEQAAHDLKKARKAARKAAKRSVKQLSDDDDDYQDHPSSHKRARTSTANDDLLFDFEDLPPQSHRAQKTDYEQIRAELEEARFREKMFNAMGEDERLDDVEARFNSYAHIPRRWKGGGMDHMDDENIIDPQMMDEEDYAEWVRWGMWKQKHAAEYEAQKKAEAERAAKREREQKVRDETERLEKQEAERRRQRRTEGHKKRWAEAREHYESRWEHLLQGAEGELRFEDIPWPVLPDEVGPAPSKKGKGRATEIIQVELEDLTVDAISTFLLPGGRPADSATTGEESAKKDRRDKLRETMLRFHPDKFEGRILRNVRESDKDRVRDAVGRVARAVNDLLADKTA